MAEEGIIDEVARLRDIIYAGRPQFLLEAKALTELKTQVSHVGSAATDSEHLFIDPEYWSGLTTEEKMFVLAHEADHYIQGDPEYVKRWGIDGDLFNIASDCTINRRLKRHFNVRREFLRNIITPESLADAVRKVALELGLPPSKIKDREWFETATKVEIYFYLEWLKQQARARGGRAERVYREEMEKERRKSLGGDVRPSKYTVEDAKARKERYERVAKDLERYFGGAGREAGEVLEREFGLGKEKINWEEIIEETFSSVTSEYVTTWKRPSRRHPSYPGYYRYGVPGAVLLVDVSGSISEKDLGVFMTEVKYLMMDYGIENATVIFWSDEVVGKMEDIGPEDVPEVVRTAKKMPAGGTLLHKALKEALKHASDDRVVIVFTDGQLGDEPKELYDPAVETAMQFAEAVLVYTVENPARAGKMPPTGWTYVRYPLRV